MTTIHIDKDLLGDNFANVKIEAKGQTLYEVMNDIIYKFPLFRDNIWSNGLWLQDVNLYFNEIYEGVSPILNSRIFEYYSLFFLKDKFVINVFWDKNIIHDFGKERSMNSYGVNVREVVNNLKSMPHNIYDKLVVNGAIVDGLELRLNLMPLSSLVDELEKVQIKRNDVLFIKDTSINANQGVELSVCNNFRRVMEIDKKVTVHGTTIGEIFDNVAKKFPDFQKLLINGEWYKGGAVFLNFTRIAPAQGDFMNIKVGAGDEIQIIAMYVNW